MGKSNVEQYELHREVARGGEGIVFEGLHKRTGTKVGAHRLSFSFSFFSLSRFSGLFT